MTLTGKKFFINGHGDQDTTQFYTIIKELGRGSQGIVYEISIPDGRRFAMKTYPKAYLSLDRNIKKRIKELAYMGSPHISFLWPQEYLELTDGSTIIEGYTMPIRLKEYVSSTELMSGKLKVDFKSIIKACMNLADAFFHLHANGLCYKDLSFGNFFFNPVNGECIICDIDNICYSGQEGGVIGTPGFMAPEVVLGHSKPSASSDLHSLAVLIFYMLYIHHPLEGKTEATIRIMDDHARRKIYGTDALYIFDPRDSRNRPEAGIHNNALIMNQILPERLKQAFEKSFTTGLHEKNQRVVEAEWKIVLKKIIDTIGHCDNCGQEVFLNEFEPETSYACWSCKEIQYPICLRLEDQIILVAPGVVITAPSGNHLGTIIRHPNNSKLMALTNETSEVWEAFKPNGNKLAVHPLKSIVIGPGLALDALGITMKLTQYIRS